VTTFYPGNTSYDALGTLNNSGGYATWALQAITGLPTSDYSFSSGDVATAWNAGQLIVLSTVSPSSTYIVGDHAYAVVGYNLSSSLPFELMNPWGADSSGWAPGEDNQIYGLFTANAPFLVQNFVDSTYDVGEPTTATVRTNTTNRADQLSVSGLDVTPRVPRPHRAPAGDTLSNRGIVTPEANSQPWSSESEHGFVWLGGVVVG
jgi:hypothetical protein